MEVDLQKHCVVNVQNFAQLPVVPPKQVPAPHAVPPPDREVTDACVAM